MQWPPKYESNVITSLNCDLKLNVCGSKRNEMVLINILKCFSMSTWAVSNEIRMDFNQHPRLKCPANVNMGVAQLN